MDVLSLVGSDSDARGARLLIDSLRRFGGEESNAPVTAFLTPGPSGETQPARVERLLDTPGTTALVLGAVDAVPRYPFARKVSACARAEEALVNGVRLSYTVAMPEGRDTLSAGGRRRPRGRREA